MIYQINKYHKTAEGETSSSEKIEKADAVEAYEKALEKFYEYGKNYMADKTVLSWNLSLIQPSDMTVKKRDSYSRTIFAAVDEPVRE